MVKLVKWGNFNGKKLASNNDNIIGWIFALKGIQVF
jgi:hypothetical protein